MKTSGSSRIFQTSLVLLATFIIALPSNAAKKPRYTVTEIVAPDSAEPLNVIPEAINRRGVVVGAVGSPERPFIYRRGVMEVLALPGPVPDPIAWDINDDGDVITTFGRPNYLLRDGVRIALNSDTNWPLFAASRINNLGVIAGSSVEEGNVSSSNNWVFPRQHAAVWSNGVVHLLRARIPDVWTYAVDINDLGVAAGVMYTSTDPEAHTAVLFRNGEMISLGTFGAFMSWSWAINNSGEVLCITAESSDWNDQKSFLVRQGRTIEFVPPQGHHTVIARGLNNRGQVVGYSITMGGELRAFLYTHGAMRDLTEFAKPNNGWTFLAAHGINDGGQIVGVGQINGGDHRAFLLTPKKLADPGALQELIQLVRTADISRNQKMPLLAWLKAAEHAFERERIEAGIRRLEVFQRKVDQPCHERRYMPGRLAMMRKPCIPPALQQQLIGAAQAIIDSFDEPEEPKVFDLADDFSLASNPAGAWTYGYQVSLSSPFIPFTFSKYNYDSYGTPVEVWSINSYEVPAIQRNATDKTVYSDGGAGTYPPGTTWFYPGPGAWEGSPSYSEAIRKQANYGVVRFTLPADAAGNYRLVADVKSAYTGWISGDTDFHIFKNGVEIFGEFLPELGAANFEDALALAPGDTIDFVIGRGADDSYHGSGLIIEARLTQMR